MLLLHLYVIDALVPEVTEPCQRVEALSQVVGVVIVRTIVILGIVALFQEFHSYGTAVSVWRCLHWHTIASYDVDVTTGDVLVLVLVACLVVLIRNVLRV